MFKKVFRSRDSMPAYGKKLGTKLGVKKPMNPERIKRAPLTYKDRGYKPSNGTNVGY